VSDGDGELELPPLLRPLLLDPAWLIATLRFRLIGERIRAGRRVRCVAAWPRDGSLDAKSYELEVDAEYGTLLRRAVSEAGSTVSVTEATEVEFDGTIDQESFDCEVPSASMTSLPSPRRERGEPLRFVGGVSTPTDSQGQPGRSGEGIPVQPGGVLWLTGLSGAGKTTVARALERLLSNRGRPSCVLDGDDLRSGLSSDLSHTRADRAEQARRVAHVAALMSRSGVVAIVALVSPFAADRALARQIHERFGLPFFEVWIDTPRSVCEERDPKSLYARARAGEVKGLSGVDAPYEIPTSADLVVSGWGEDPETLVVRIAHLLDTETSAVDLPARFAHPMVM
jgi:adenylyl-sulfate kinase